jgi:hypothetical protein
MNLDLQRLVDTNVLVPGDILIESLAAEMNGTSSGAY